MMLFRVVKANLGTILADAAAGRYRVVGHQKQGTGADEVLGLNRRVMVYYDAGQFPKDKSPMSGPFTHDMTFGMLLTVAEQAQADLAVLNDPESTPVQRQAASAAKLDADALADASMDELFDIVYQILMDARNIDIGFDKPLPVSNRWVESFQKADPLPDGQYVTLEGTIQFTCRAQEAVTGDAGTAGTAPLTEQRIDLDGDDVEQTRQNV